MSTVHAARRRTLLAVSLLALGATGAFVMQRSGEAEPPPPAAGPPPGEAGSGPDGDVLREEDLSATSRPAPEPSRIEVPEDGPGTFRTAAAREGRAGDGAEVYRYRVQVEDGIALEPDEAAAEIHAILGHPRGWTNDGGSAFELVGAGGGAELVVKIATPATVDELCGEYGLDTQGEVNCRIGDEVVVNLRRWVEGSPQFPGPIEEYRALIVNHEVGHRLGHGHAGCPGKGEPAPAMMQQIKGLDGCVANAWPYDEDGGYLDGPWVP